MANLPTLQTTRKFNQSVQIYSKSGQVIRVPRCFAFMFTNVGDTTCRVNGMVVYPGDPVNKILGDSRTVAVAQDNVEYVGNITVAFDTGGAAPAVEIVQLFYAN